MGDSTEQVAVETSQPEAEATPRRPASAEDTGLTQFTPSEVKAFEQRAAANARRQAEEEWKKRLADEVAAREAELEKYRQAEQAIKDAELSDLERERKTREELTARVDSLAQENQTLTGQLTGAERRSQVSLLIAASRERVPARYHADVYATLADADAITQEAVDEALVAAKAAWDADIAAYAPPPASGQTPPKSVGSATAPPANQPVQPQTDEERKTYIASLVERTRAGDEDAGRELDKLYGQRKPSYQ